jgi:hypothetical protein
MRLSVVVVSIIALILLFSFVVVSLGPFQPLGRLSFVKLENPDMYPGHPHSTLLAQYAEKKGSKCAMVLHFAGSSRYASYQEDNVNSTSDPNGVYIIEVAFIDTQGGGSSSLNQINILDSLKVALFGVPDGRYLYMSDGVIYTSYDSMIKHVNSVAKQHGQQGAIPMVYHGTVRTDNPILAPGCGFPLYFQILTKTYGIIPAYIYTISGMLFPYLESPYRNYELLHSTELQYYYNNGYINIDYTKGNTNTSKYYGGSTSYD